MFFDHEKFLPIKPFPKLASRGSWDRRSRLEECERALCSRV